MRSGTELSQFLKIFLPTSTSDCHGRTKTRPRGYKTFFILNSAEHEILDTHKYKNIKKSGFFMLR